MIDHRAADRLGDTAYPATYFRELSPAWLNYVAAIHGIAAPALGEPFRYLELGCGDGLSTLLHAAAFPDARFHACDMNPHAIHRARRLGSDLGITNVTFHAEDFAALQVRDLAPFDYVVAHGVYSWVEPEVRRCMRETMSALLGPGGLVYLSYNCLPGWTSEIPLRRLMTELSAGMDGDGASRAAAAAGTLQRLAESGCAYFRNQPEARAAVAAYQRQPPGYLAHEFLGAAFAPFYSVDVSDDMSAHGFTLVGSATLVDNHRALLVDSRTAQILDELPTERQRQLAMDFGVNRRFRRDVYARAADTRRVSPAPLIVGCTRGSSAIDSIIDVPRGRIRFERPFIEALRTLMQEGAAPLHELAGALSTAPAQRPEVLRNLLYLVAGGQLQPFARRSSAAPVESGRGFPSVAVQRVMTRLAAGEDGWIPSPVAGGGIAIEVAEARAIIAMADGVAHSPPLAPARVRQLAGLGILT